MTTLKYKSFKNLCSTDRQLIVNKFKGSNKDKQKIIRIPALNTVWLLVPPGKTCRNIIKAQKMIVNFGNPDCIISTDIPSEFLGKIK